MGSLLPERPSRTPLSKKPMPATTDFRPSTNLAPVTSSKSTVPPTNVRRGSMPASRSSGKVPSGLPEVATTKNRGIISLPVLPFQSKTASNSSPRKKSTTSAGAGASHVQQTAAPTKGAGSPSAVSQTASLLESTTGSTPRQRVLPPRYHQQLHHLTETFDLNSNSPSDAAMELHSVPVRPPRRKNAKLHPKHTSSATTPSSTATTTAVAKTEQHAVSSRKLPDHSTVKIQSVNVGQCSTDTGSALPAEATAVRSSSVSPCSMSSGKRRLLPTVSPTTYLVCPTNDEKPASSLVSSSTVVTVSSGCTRIAVNDSSADVDPRSPGVVTVNVLPVADDESFVVSPMASPRRGSILKKTCRPDGTRLDADHPSVTGGDNNVDASGKKSSLRRPLKCRQQQPRRTTTFSDPPAAPPRRVLFKNNVSVYQFVVDQETGFVDEGSDDVVAGGRASNNLAVVSRLKSDSENYNDDGRSVNNVSLTLGRPSSSSQSPDLSMELQQAFQTSMTQPTTPTVNPQYRRLNLGNLQTPVSFKLSKILPVRAHNGSPIDSGSKTNDSRRPEIENEIGGARRSVDYTRMTRSAGDATMATRRQHSPASASKHPWLSLRGSDGKTVFLVSSNTSSSASHGGGSLRVTTTRSANTVRRRTDNSATTVRRRMDNGLTSTCDSRSDVHFDGMSDALRKLPRTPPLHGVEVVGSVSRDARRSSPTHTTRRSRSAERPGSGHHQLDRAVSLPDVNSCYIPVEDDRSVCTSTSVQHGRMVSDHSTTSVSDVLSSSRRLLIAFKLPVNGGRSYDADNLLVKANRDGSRVRVVYMSPDMVLANGDVVRRSPVSRTELDEQLRLPYLVDPYRLMARLEAGSTLVIEAPIVG